MAARDKKNPTKQRLIARSLAIAGFLTILKVTVGLASHSIAILASAADSLMDFLVSLANFVFIRSAAKPPDKDHPYGHGKIESLAGLFQSLVIGGVALGVAGGAVHRFINPMHIERPLAGVGVILISIALTLWHVRRLRVSVVVSQSQVMSAEYLHYASDTFANVGVIAAIGLEWATGKTFWDPLMSLLIVAYILRSVAKIFHSALAELMDEQLPDEVLEDVGRTIMNYHPKIIAYHDLRSRKVGETKFFEFHLELRDVEQFHEAHAISEGLIAILKAKYPRSVITVHQDPEGAM